MCAGGGAHGHLAPHLEPKLIWTEQTTSVLPLSKASWRGKPPNLIFTCHSMCVHSRSTAPNIVAGGFAQLLPDLCPQNEQEQGFTECYFLRSCESIQQCPLTSDKRSSSPEDNSLGIGTPLCNTGQRLIFPPSSFQRGTQKACTYLKNTT